ncbi:MULTISPECIES: hypothetical protein [Pseudomonas]|uniref:hypothetical protein n=1 Tax=Pseudomonas TaxID=286 RepID=UPI0027E2B56C|nr:hypothetical protein [Pseudomonas mosselii]
MDRECLGSSDTFDAPASPNHEHALPTTVSESLQLALDAGAIIGTWEWAIPENRVTADERFSRSFGLPSGRCLQPFRSRKHFHQFTPVTVIASADIQEAMKRGGA